MDKILPTICCFLLFCVASFSTAFAQTSLKYNLGTSGSSVPYENAVDELRPGILVEILPLVMDEANIDTEKVMLSTKRAMRAFKNGELDFDFFSPGWLSEEDKPHDFLFSLPILEITEYLVTLPENTDSYQNLEDAYNKPVGTVSGYIYFDDNEFSRLDFESESTLLLGLANQRVEVAILEQAAANYWSAKQSIPISFGAIHTQGNLCIRLHKRHADKLPMINNAIKELHKQGKITAVLQKYADFSGVID